MIVFNVRPRILRKISKIERNFRDRLNKIYVIPPPPPTLVSDNVADIAKLAFKTGISPKLCKLTKIIPIFKYLKSLPIKMYSFLDANTLIYNKQFEFRSDYSASHAIINTIEFTKEKLGT